MNRINRKNFLIGSGVMLTVPAFLQNCSTVPGRLSGKSGFDPLENADAEGYDKPIYKVINAGITAPNSHNVQPWKFRILSDTEMILYVDEKRILPVTDPPARQIHISHGCFLELLKIGAAQIGYGSEIKILPEGDYSFSEIGKKPTASIKLRSASKSGHPLYEAVKKRATDRSEYTGDYVTENQADDMRKLGNSIHSSLHFILGKENISSLMNIFYESMKLESFTYRTNDETRTWFRFNEKEIQTKRDGLSLPGQGVTGFTRWMAETFFMGPEPEKFHNRSGLEMFLERYKNNIDSAKGIVYWKTSGNTKKDWIYTGMDYARFQLAVTLLGYKMHPMSQPLQEFPEMDVYRKALDSALSVKSSEKIQMIARLGKSSYSYFTPRRSQKEMLVAPM